LSALIYNGDRAKLTVIAVKTALSVYIAQMSPRNQGNMLMALKNKNLSDMHT